MKKNLFALVILLSLSSSVQPAKDWSWGQWATEGFREVIKKADDAVQAIKEKLITPEITGKFVAADNIYKITVSLPGYNEKDIEVEISPNKIVTIKASRQVSQEKRDAKGNLISKEVSKEAFQKTFEISQEIIITDMKGVKAELKDGILTISIPAKKQTKEKKAGSVKVTVKSV